MTAEQVEEWIRAALEDVFDGHTEASMLDTSFDALGVDSVSRAGLLAQLAKTVRYPIDLDEAYEYETPRRLAAYVAHLVNGQISRRTGT